MFRRVVLVLLGAVSIVSATLGVMSRNSSMIYFCDPIVTPTWCKLDTAQADRGVLRVSFMSLGEFEYITEQDMPHGRSKGVGPSPPHPMTIWRRLEVMGFYHHWFAGWSYGGGTDENGK